MSLCYNTQMRGVPVNLSAGEFPAERKLLWVIFHEWTQESH